MRKGFAAHNHIYLYIVSLSRKTTVMWFYRVATVREKHLENEIFSRSGKSLGIFGWPGKFRKDLESQGNVREFENEW